MVNSVIIRLVDVGLFKHTRLTELKLWCEIGKIKALVFGWQLVDLGTPERNWGLGFLEQFMITCNAYRDCNISHFLVVRKTACVFCA